MCKNYSDVRGNLIYPHVAIPVQVGDPWAYLRLFKFYFKEKSQLHPVASILLNIHLSSALQVWKLLQPSDVVPTLSLFT